MFRRRFFWVSVCILIGAASLAGQPFPGEGQTGDAAVAERYFLWIKNVFEDGRLLDAEAALERAADYSGVSSDISYLQALVRSELRRPRGAVLESLRRARETGRWNHYSEQECRLLEAENLIAIRAFSEALSVLSSAGSGADSLVLRLKALRGSSDRLSFQRAMDYALEAFPRDVRPVQIFFEYAGNTMSSGKDAELMDLVLRRLPVLLEADPALSYEALPFMRDRDACRRLLGAYRADGAASPASVPAALDLGLIGDEAAVEELFGISHNGADVSYARETALDVSLLRAVWELLRSDTGRSLFLRNLSSFSGVIFSDGDGDGYIEESCRYSEGMPRHYSYDADQDRLPELEIFFSAGIPSQALAVILPDQPDAGSAGETSLMAYPVSDRERSKVSIRWEQYPAVLQAEAEGMVYTPPPFV
ncbi:hypothetical protein LJC14_07455, partial [Treponema sp. OttesenSCG-928-L16]|nr:hypothetical protein [Treponema sp. OttesenSCG-928-L16]